MAINRFGRVVSVVVVTVAVGLIPALPSSAFGGGGTCVPLTTQGPLDSGGASAAGQSGFFDVTPTHQYWSIVAARGSQGGRPNVGFYTAPPTSCGQLAASVDPDPGDADWVAFDNNLGRLPVQPYAVNFSDRAIIQFVAGSRTLSTTDPGVAQPIGRGGGYDEAHIWIADVRDVYLTGGMTYTFRVTGGFSGLYLLHSKDSDSSTWNLTPATASAKLELAKHVSDPTVDVLTLTRTGTLTFKDVNINAWYGFVVARDGWWGNAVTVTVSAAPSA